MEREATLLSGKSVDLSARTCGDLFCDREAKFLQEFKTNNFALFHKLVTVPLSPQSLVFVFVFFTKALLLKAGVHLPIYQMKKQRLSRMK